MNLPLQLARPDEHWTNENHACPDMDPVQTKHASCTPTPQIKVQKIHLMAAQNLQTLRHGGNNNVWVSCVGDPLQTWPGPNPVPHLNFANVDPRHGRETNFGQLQLWPKPNWPMQKKSFGKSTPSTSKNLKKNWKNK